MEGSSAFATSFVRDAARLGIDPSGWDADWAAARIFLAGLDDERCRSFGALGGLD